MNTLAFISFFSGNKESFSLKVADIAKKLLIDPNSLMLVMWIESRLNPKAQNTKYLVGGKPATGLIQFTTYTAKYLGTSIESLLTMSAEDQLDYVYKYLKPYTGRMKDFTDVYLAVFFPAAIGKPDEYVLKTSSISASAIAKSNPIFDLNKDLQVTKAELREAVRKQIPLSLLKYFAIKTLPLLLLFFGVGSLLYYNR